MSGDGVRERASGVLGPVLACCVAGVVPGSVGRHASGWTVREPSREGRQARHAALAIAIGKGIYGPPRCAVSAQDSGQCRARRGRGPVLLAPRSSVLAGPVPRSASSGPVSLTGPCATASYSAALHGRTSTFLFCLLRGVPTYNDKNVTSG